MLYAGTATRVIALVARDKRGLKLALTVAKAVTTWRLVARDGQLVGQWLNAA